MAHHYDHLRAKAIQLRTERHMTLDDIVDCLQLPKTTIYCWIKDIPIPRTKKQTAAQLRKAELIRERAAAVREAWYQQGLAEAPELIKEPTFRDFVVLYMAEGAKRDRNTVAFVNSDPQLVLLANRWIKALTSRKLEYSLQYHADHNVAELKQYWGGILEIEPDIIKLRWKSNSGQLAGRKFRSVYGLLTVRSSDTQLMARLHGWMDYVKTQW